MINETIVKELVLEKVVIVKTKPENHSELKLEIIPLPETDTEIIGNLIEFEADGEKPKRAWVIRRQDKVRVIVGQIKPKLKCNVKYDKQNHLGEMIPIDLELECEPNCWILSGQVEILEVLPDGSKWDTDDQSQSLW